MSEIGRIHQLRSLPYDSPVKAPQPGHGGLRAARAADRVELSVPAQLLSRLAQLPEVRQELVDRVRAQIEAGTYDTPDKIDALLNDLLEDLR